MRYKLKFCQCWNGGLNCNAWLNINFQVPYLHLSFENGKSCCCLCALLNKLVLITTLYLLSALLLILRYM
jgi:hypothetical protein